MDHGRRFRNLGGALEGVVVKCATLEEVEDCFRMGICTAPVEDLAYLKHVKKNRPIFLFQEDKRLLHGVLRSGGLEQSPCQAQTWVRASEVSRYRPLRECDFSPKIQRCYFSAKEFYCELDMEETLEVFNVFDDCPISSEIGEAGVIQSSSTISSSKCCGLLGSSILELPSKEVAGTHAALDCEAFTRMEIEDLGNSTNDNLEAGLEYNDGSSSNFPYSMARGETTDSGKENSASGKRQMHRLNLESAVMFAMRQQPEVETKTLTRYSGSRIEPRSLQDNAGFGANCLPVAFGNHGANEGNATFPNRVDIIADDKMSSGSFGQSLYPVPGMHSIPAGTSPTVSNENNETLEDASKLRHEIRHCMTEILRLKDECRKLRAEEVLGKRHTEEVEATLQSQVESGTKLTDELHQAKKENKSLSERVSELSSALEVAKKELAEAREGLRTSRNVQETLLKIQNETMNEMDRKRNEHIELNVKYQEVMASNKRLEAKLDRLCRLDQNCPTLQAAMGLHDGSPNRCRAIASNESVSPRFHTMSFQDGSVGLSDLQPSVLSEPADARARDAACSPMQTTQLASLVNSRFGTATSMEQSDRTLSTDEVHTRENINHEQPRICGYPPGLEPSPPSSRDNVQESSAVPSIRQESWASKSPAHSSFDQTMKPNLQIGMVSSSQALGGSASHIVQAPDQSGLLTGVRHPTSVPLPVRSVEMAICSEASVRQDPILVELEAPNQERHQLPTGKISPLRARDNSDAAFAQQESKKKQKRDFSSISLPIPKMEPMKTGTDNLTQQNLSQPCISGPVSKSSDVSKAMPTVVATAIEGRAIQLPIPALVNKPISVAPPVPKVMEPAKSVEQSAKNTCENSAPLTTVGIPTPSFSSIPTSVCGLSMPVDGREKTFSADDAARDSRNVGTGAILPTPGPQLSYLDKDRNRGTGKPPSLSGNILVDLAVRQVLPAKNEGLHEQRKGDTQKILLCEVSQEQLSGAKKDTEVQHNLSNTRPENDIASLVVPEIRENIDRSSNFGLDSAGYSERETLLVFGGKNEEEIDLRMGQRYTTSSGAWTAILGCSLPKNLEASSLVSICYSGTVFIAGGISSSGVPDGTFHSFSLATGEWKQLPSIPTSRAASGLVEVDGRLYVVGGRNIHKSFVTVDVFDPEACKWLSGPLMKSQRAYHSTVMCGGCIFSVGGMLTHEILSSAERLDPRVGVWEKIANMSSPRTALGCTSNSVNIVAAGGVTCATRGNDFSVLNSVEIYEPRRNLWTLGIPMGEPRAWCSLTYLDNCLYAIGGKKTLDTNEYAEIEVFKVQNDSAWSLVSSNPDKRAFHTTCIVAST